MQSSHKCLHANVVTREQSGRPSFAFVATGSNRHMNSEEVIVIASTTESAAGAPWQLQHCTLNATNQCCEDFTSPPYFDGALRPKNATCLSENCCSQWPQCLASVTEPRYCGGGKLGGMVGEGCDLQLQCPPGQRITGIEFADWGRPVAMGGGSTTEPSTACTFQSQANCTSAGVTKQAVEKLCLGKESCLISTANTHNPGSVNAGDPCPGHHKRLAVAASGCSATPAPPPRDPTLGRQVLLSPRPNCWDKGGICAGPSPQQLSNGDWLYLFNHDSHNHLDVSGRCSVGWSVLDKVS
jgi:hypothetical protein